LAPSLGVLYSGHDGQTHFEARPLRPEESHNIALQAGANLVFRCFPAEYWSDWYTAPRRQYIFILLGQTEIGIGDGTTRRFLDRVMWSLPTTSQARATREFGERARRAAQWGGLLQDHGTAENKPCCRRCGWKVSILGVTATSAGVKQIFEVLSGGRRSQKEF
jgi:hypothetical protein